MHVPPAPVREGAQYCVSTGHSGLQAGGRGVDVVDDGVGPSGVVVVVLSPTVVVLAVEAGDDVVDEKVGRGTQMPIFCA